MIDVQIEFWLEVFFFRHYGWECIAADSDSKHSESTAIVR